ncbi:flagellar assembly protein FliH [Salirhabdus salicampi]|uniref:flagellar assembly protein FliH n=1 Tax=Salirhabdus salicampi TaxID=476102 RepID=UPI0020C1D9C7|nr:flagellar assembly protein FliH [Salirhabdus salicampi]MCP8616523.1 flagellar assembly protein FliH [Salirhabdus salicampi]
MSNVFKSGVGNQYEKIMKVKPITTFHQEEKLETTTNTEADVDKKLAEAQSIVENAKEQAEQLIAKANEQIAAEKRHWEREQEQLKQEAQELGYTEGYKAGKEEALAHYRSKIDEANSIVNMAKKEAMTTVESSEETILNLGIQVAEKIVHSTIERNEEAFLHIVKAAIKCVKDHPNISLYVHPTQYEHVLSHETELKNIVESNASFAIYPIVDLVEESSCVIETPLGKVDASVDTQLTELKKKLGELVEEAKL